MAERTPLVPVVFLAMLMALVALGVDLLLPAFDDVREAFDLGPDSNRPSLLITSYFLGLAIPQVVWGPLSDRYGRKPIMWASFAVYGLGAVGAALAPTFGALLAARLVWGVGAAGARVVVVAIIRDQHEGDQMARFLSLVMAVFMVVPVFAPALGTIALTVIPWRGLFWLTAVLLGALWVWSARMPETLDPANRLPLDPSSIKTAMGLVLRTPTTAAYTAATVFIQGAFASYLASSELVIDEVFGREDQFAVIFGAVAVALTVGALLAARLVVRVGGEKMVRWGFVLSSSVSVVMLVVAVTADGRPEFWVFFPVLMVQAMFHTGLMPTLNSLALEPLGRVAGTAAAVTGALRVAGGAVGGAVIDRFIGDTVTPWAIGFLLGSLASLVAVMAVRTPRAEPSATA